MPALLLKVKLASRPGHVAAAYVRQLKDANVFDQPIVTTLEPLEQYFEAEAYHQGFVARNPNQPYVALKPVVVSAQSPASHVSELETYIGAYQLEDTGIARIMLRGTGLVAEIGAARPARLKATSQGVFEAEGVDPYRVTFDTARMQLQIARATSSQTGRRILVTPDVLGRYAGTYPLSDTLAMVVTLEGGRLIAQVTGASRHPLFPESTTRFFVQDSASTDVAHLEFGADPDGKAFVVFRQMDAAQKVYRK